MNKINNEQPDNHIPFEGILTEKQRTEGLLAYRATVLHRREYAQSMEFLEEQIQVTTNLRQKLLKEGTLTLSEEHNKVFDHLVTTLISMKLILLTERNDLLDQGAKVTNNEES